MLAKNNPQVSFTESNYRESDTFRARGLEHSETKEWARRVLPNIPAMPIVSAEREASKASVMQIQMEIDKLQDEIDRKSIKMAQQYAILSPIRIIPHELLARILAMVINPIIYRNGRNSNLACLTVCHLWRNTALSTPACWNAINVQHSGKLKVFQRILAFQLEKHLPRSGNLPLHLVVSLSRTFVNGLFPSTISEQLQKIGARLQTYAEFGFKFFHSVFVTTTTPFHLLTQLRLHSFSDNLPDSSWHFPVLGSLYIHLLAVSPNLQKLNCPQLKSFTIGSLVYEDPQSNLRRENHLENFLINLNSLRTLEVPWSATFHLTSYKHEGIETLLIHRSNSDGLHVPLWQEQIPVSINDVANRLLLFPKIVKLGLCSQDLTSTGNQGLDDLETLNKIRNLELRGMLPEAWEPATAFKCITTLRINSKVNSDHFLYNGNQGYDRDHGGSYIKGLLQNFRMANGLQFSNWVHLRNLELYGKVISWNPSGERTQNEEKYIIPLYVLLDVLERRGEETADIRDNPTDKSTSPLLLLSLQDCALSDPAPSGSTLRVPIPDSYNLAYEDVEKLFEDCCEKLRLQSASLPTAAI